MYIYHTLSILINHIIIRDITCSSLHTRSTDSFCLSNSQPSDLGTSLYEQVSKRRCRFVTGQGRAGNFQMCCPNAQPSEHWPGALTLNLSSTTDTSIKYFMECARTANDDYKKYNETNHIKSKLFFYFIH